MPLLALTGDHLQRWYHHGIESGLSPSTMNNTATTLSAIFQNAIDEGTATRNPVNLIPVEWTYHQTAESKPDATIKLNPNGVFEIDDGGGVKTGSWKAGKKPGLLTILFNNNTWNVTVKDGLGTIQRDVGTRYMRPVTSK